MKRLVGAALCAAMWVAAPALVAQDDKAVYRWVDELGVVHYSDQPRDGAEKVVVREPQSYSSAEATPAPAARPQGVEAVVPATAVAYTVRVAQPEPDSVAWNIGGELPVAVEVQPALDIAAGHRVVFHLNGEAKESIAGIATTLSGVNRGTHQVHATVINADGDELSRSGSVTFHVRQTSIQNPQRRR